MTRSKKSYLSLREDRYRPIFAAAASFAPIREIWKSVLGEQYLEEVNAFGFVTKADLQDMANALGDIAGRTLVDVGCGGGGPGLWVARQTHAELIGVDILQEAIDRAVEMQKAFANGPRAAFQVGSFTGTGLPDACAAAVMSVDAFWMVMDKLAALQEVARIMMPGAIFAMTTWAAGDVSWPDWLEGTGLRLVSCQETPRWKENQLPIYQAICDRQAELQETLDPGALQILLSEAEEAPKMLNSAHRFLVVAQRE